MRGLDRPGQYVNRPPVQCLGLGELTATPADHREVVQRRADLRVFRPEQPFFDFQCRGKVARPPRGRRAAERSPQGFRNSRPPRDSPARKPAPGRTLPLATVLLPRHIDRAPSGWTPARPGRRPPSRGRGRAGVPGARQLAGPTARRRRSLAARAGCRRGCGRGWPRWDFPARPSPRKWPGLVDTARCLRRTGPRSSSQTPRSFSAPAASNDRGPNAASADARAFCSTECASAYRPLTRSAVPRAPSALVRVSPRATLDGAASAIATARLATRSASSWAPC